MPANELRRRVRARETAYETFHPQWFWEVRDFSATGTHQFEVADGIWGYSEHEDSEETFCKLRLEELVPPDYEGGRWEREKDVGMNAADFSFWLGMDALVLMEPLDNGEVRRIHFRRLSVNEPHPLAAVPYMDFRHVECEIWESCNTVSYEERVAMIFGDYEGGIRRTAVIILDWRMGKILLPYTVASDLAFLTKDLILIVQDTLDQDSLMEFDVRSLETGRSLYRCQLPLPASQYRPCFLTHPASHHGGRSPTKQAKMFVPDPIVEILGIIFHTTPTELGDQSKSFTVVLSIQLFIKKCQELAAASASVECSPSDAPPLFEWEEWGPQVTRWFPNGIHKVGARTTFGSRMLAVMVATMQEGHVWMNRVYTLMLDFNPRPIFRGAQDEETEDYIVRVLDDASKCESGDISVTSVLPCRIWVSKRRYGYLNLFLDGNTIVGRLDEAYHFFSFLPRTRTDEDEKVPPRIL